MCMDYHGRAFTGVIVVLPVPVLREEFIRRFIPIALRHCGKCAEHNCNCIQVLWVIILTEVASLKHHFSRLFSMWSLLFERDFSSLDIAMRSFLHSSCSPFTTLGRSIKYSTPSIKIVLSVVCPWVTHVRFISSGIFRYDLPELDGLDNIHNPEGPLLQALLLAARYFNAHRTWFLVNGRYYVCLGLSFLKSSSDWLRNLCIYTARVACSQRC